MSIQQSNKIRFNTIMKVNTKYIYIIALYILSTSCTNTNTNLFKGKVLFCKQFRAVIELNGQELVLTDSIGLGLICVAPPYLVIPTYKSPFFFKIFDLESGKLVGEYGEKGNGPTDFTSFSLSNQQQSRSRLVAKDFLKKELCIVDVDKTIIHHQPQVSSRISYKGYCNDPIQLFYIDSTLLRIKTLDPKRGVEYIQVNPTTGERIGAPIAMYNEIIPTRESMIMRLITDCTHPYTDMIASISGKLNQIDILSLSDKNKNRSFTTSEKLITLNDIILMHRDAPDYYYSYPICNEKMIWALYKRGNTQCEIHVIDWSGKDLYCLKPDRMITSFDIDWSRGIMYGLSEDEKVFTFDIRSILNNSVTRKDHRR